MRPDSRERARQRAKNSRDRRRQQAASGTSAAAEKPPQQQRPTADPAAVAKNAARQQVQRAAAAAAETAAAARLADCAPVISPGELRNRRLLMLAMVAMITDWIAGIEAQLPAEERTPRPEAAGPLPTMTPPTVRQPPTEPQPQRNPVPPTEPQQPPAPPTVAELQPMLLLTDGAQQAETAAAA